MPGRCGFWPRGRRRRISGLLIVELGRRGTIADMSPERNSASLFLTALAKRVFLSSAEKQRQVDSNDTFQFSIQFTSGGLLLLALLRNNNDATIRSFFMRNEMDYF